MPPKLKGTPPTKPRFSKISKIPKPYKTLTSVISSAKPIKSWYEAVTKDEETNILRKYNIV
jgi:hypothetical protein